MGEVILRGAAQGFALGTLVTVSTLCTASHYKNNIALASTISSSAAFLGAVVYTGIAYGFLPKSQPDMAYLASFGITAGTLGISGWLIKQNRFYSRLRMSPQAQRQPTYGFKTTSSLLFPLGFCLTFSGIFIWPAYMILLIVSPPAQAPVSIAYQQALLMHAFGFLSAAFSCSPWLRSRLGPVNTFISASGIAGACYLTPGWMPWSIITLPLSLVYGACLGAILSLYIKVLYTAAWFGHPEPRTRGAPHLGVGIVLAVSGTLAACGVLGAAAMVDAGLGFRWGMSGSGGVVVLGAVVMGVGRVVGVGRGVIRVV
ncbi:hypothetical protein M011DRAFT_408031 [Sporormia fimetaria CBS 119925]|uniref:MFS general substrate transporter n=1 Tax=Sporormia fimetaria CBS 119925 TaxID=1340428 RepID=A0A6A6V2J5_9PLEO|nr:hypothetical protein M011DRAFT_408031 [Sporormia fimetaria CBS 119925]